ncbi:MAG: hypothetical protein QCH35_07450 [Methanomicrobiaceae archaeon]|nr:hypothetical protein [Methanomicrobiaceae archaeon]
MNPRILSIFALIAALMILSCGCVEIGSTTRSAGNVLAEVEIVEHTYLWGDDGPFTKLYDIRVRSFGVDVLNLKGVTRQEMEAIQAKYG